jgi:hypothetical protein
MYGAAFFSANGETMRMQIMYSQKIPKKLSDPSRVIHMFRIVRTFGF